MKSLDSFRNIMRGSGLVLSVVGLLIFLSPVTSWAVVPSFFQGFEVDTFGWFTFPTTFGSASVTKVSSPDTNPSPCYSGSTTCFYASPVDAATGNGLGRVNSAIAFLSDSTHGSCDIDVGQYGGNGVMPGIGPSLICQGPYTLWGLDPTKGFIFPTDGYTTQVDIYLDVTYAGHHPDCIKGPCTPDTPGTLNPACAAPPVGTAPPNGITCEGSRFDWDVALNKPDGTGEIGPEFVFSVGTAPDPSGQVQNCNTGWIITAGYNSYRSGGDTYNLGFEPRCLSTSGWYTFKQVFHDDGSGNLEVDFSILDPSDTSGNPVACTDAAGNASTCSWVRKPGKAISAYGCPLFGWLSNEEINYLPLDNTELIVDGCGFLPLPRPGQITPTNTTCQQFTSSTAQTLGSLLYTVKSGKINSVSPGVFFYYATVIGKKGDTVKITELSTPTYSPILVQQSQAILYSSTCTKLATLSGDSNGNVDHFTLPSDGTFIIGVKYSASSLNGQPIPQPSTITTINYTFNTLLNGNTISQDSAAITLSPKH